MEKFKDFLAFSWKGIIVSVMLLALFCLGGSLGVLRYLTDTELQQAIEKRIIVEAQIVRLSYTSSMPHGRGSTYTIIYSYTDDDTGIVYEGGCGRGDYRTEERDKQRIGEKVEIYIGGLSKAGLPLSSPVSYGTEVSMTDAIVVMSVFFSLIFIYIVLIVLYVLYFFGKLPEMRRKR